MSRSERPPLVAAHALAVEAEELYEEGRWKRAADRFEAASEQYVRATLCTADADSLQSLRLLALAHSQRAHELRCRLVLHDALKEGGPTASPTAEKDDDGSARAPAAAAASNPALSRLGSQLISTLESLSLGAEELSCIDLLHAFTPAPRSSAIGSSAISSGSLRCHSPTCARSSVQRSAGAFLSDSYCVVPGACGSPINARRDVLRASGPVVSPVSSPMPPANPTPAESQLAALRQQLAVASAENAAHKARANEMQAMLGKVQRRAAEQVRAQAASSPPRVPPAPLPTPPPARQLRLSKKALTMLHEVQAIPRADLSPQAATEVRHLRQQLEQAHSARRQQAEVVRKYEQRWAQLKASARRKQAQQQQQREQQAQPAQPAQVQPEQVQPLATTQSSQAQPSSPIAHAPPHPWKHQLQPLQYSVLGNMMPQPGLGGAGSPQQAPQAQAHGGQASLLGSMFARAGPPSG